jgi:hypothetical protein
MVGYISTVILLDDVIILEKRSSCRFAVEKERCTLLDTTPCMAPFWPEYVIDEFTKLLRNIIESTEEIDTWELNMLVVPERSIKMFCFAA